MSKLVNGQQRMIHSIHWSTYLGMWFLDGNAFIWINHHIRIVNAAAALCLFNYSSNYKNLM